MPVIQTVMVEILLESYIYKSSLPYIFYYEASFLGACDCFNIFIFSVKVCVINGMCSTNELDG